jgi:hypothetical protein
MVDTIDNLDSDSEATERVEHPNRGLKIAVAVLAVVVIALGGVVLTLVRDGDDGAASVPDDVQQVLDDYEAAVENNDVEAFRAVVTDDFRRPEYYGDGDGAPYRGVQTADNLAAYLRANEGIEIEKVGDPVVVAADGTWYVAYPERWIALGTGTGYEYIYTYVVVDEGGTLKLDDAYWAGSVTLIDE